MAEIATRPPLSVAASATTLEALLLMVRHDVHHLPLLDATRLAGMISAGDLAAQQSASAVVSAGEIHAQDNLAGLRRACIGIRHLQRARAVADTSANATGHIITAITDTLTTRLLHLAERCLSLPPVPYARVAAGSQARARHCPPHDSARAKQYRPSRRSRCSGRARRSMRRRFRPPPTC